MTENQLAILARLDEGPRTSRQVADSFGVSRAGWPLTTYDVVHSSLRRMEDREWVRRVNGKWELTRAGRLAAGL